MKAWRMLETFAGGGGSGGGGFRPTPSALFLAEPLEAEGIPRLRW